MAKKAKRRKDCFFGLHFDLHPNEKDTSLGADITEAMIERLLRKARPDFVQYDCKGHRGHTGYATRVGWPSPGIRKDSLRVWRKVTKEHGVGLFIHYSGVWDSLAIEHHPEWARIDEKGRADKDATSNFGPYWRELLVPQVIEAAGKYDLEGIWIDGDCWATKVDYSKASRDAFRKTSGIRKIPRKPGDPHWREYKDFNREQYRVMSRQRTDALHEALPGFEVCCNWSFSTFMPEPVTVDVDFLSGDYSPNDSMNTARYDARYLDSTEMPWDLMAWGFNRGKETHWSHKPAVELKQEAAVVLAQGGGFQVYYQPTRSGRLDDWLTDIMAEVADFCRARKPVSFRTETVPQVALLLAAESARERTEALFGRGAGQIPAQGALHALLELGYSVDVLAEHQLQPRLKEYPLVVLPECHVLPKDFRKALLDYVDEGGSVLLIGQEAARLFRKELGVRFLGGPKETDAYVRGGAVMGRLGGKWQSVEPMSALVLRSRPLRRVAKVLARRFATHDPRKGAEPAATIAGCGKGKIGAIYGPLGSTFYKAHIPALREFLGGVVKRLFPKPMVELDAPPCVDLTLRRKGETLLIHLANTACKQTDPSHSLIDFIPPVGPVEVAVRLPGKPRKVRLVGEKAELTTRWTKGLLKVRLERLHIHAVVVVE